MLIHMFDTDRKAPTLQVCGALCCRILTRLVSGKGCTSPAVTIQYKLYTIT